MLNQRGHQKKLWSKPKFLDSAGWAFGTPEFFVVGDIPVECLVSFLDSSHQIFTASMLSSYWIRSNHKNYTSFGGDNKNIDLVDVCLKVQCLFKLETKDKWVWMVLTVLPYCVWWAAPGILFVRSNCHEIIFLYKHSVWAEQLIF